ncbi:MAG: CCA tRNA nucleotidyltransferase [bacterium]|nr:CCA tRNA nucleotidyltransferase [bacterium]
MFESSLNILKKIEQEGYSAYIVGGYVRDYLLKRSSNDVDIATNATPKQIKEIFPDSFLPNEAYGSITVIYNKIRFEITTFRKELTYLNNRKPIEIEYINSLIDDLKRRDFTINTLCMNKDGVIIDPLDGINDIKNHIIKTVSNSVESFTDDSLRILRAIRFYTVLDFDIEEETKNAILKTKKYLYNISYERKKDELNKIFTNENAKKGIDLILELGLDNELEIYNLKDIKLSNDLIGVWSSLNVCNKYPFTKTEKDLIKKINMVKELDNLDPEVLYKYGPYVNKVAGTNKGIDNAKIINKYNTLPIKSRSDILISGDEIMHLFNKKPGKYINDVYIDLENNILKGKIKNDNSDIVNYIKCKYLGEENETEELT